MSCGKCPDCGCVIESLPLECGGCGSELHAVVHFNRLTPEQAESLALLAEECAEVIQVITKIQRHGLESWHPDTRERNSDLLQKEVGDVLAAIRIAEVQKLVDYGRAIKNRDAKMRRVPQFLHHAKVWPDDAP